MESSGYNFKLHIKKHSNKKFYFLSFIKNI